MSHLTRARTALTTACVVAALVGCGDEQARDAGTVGTPDRSTAAAPDATSSQPGSAPTSTVPPGERPQPGAMPTVPGPSGERPPPRRTAAERRQAERRRLQEGIEFRRSRAIGTPNAGRLERGVRLPREGVHFRTWDPVRWRAPNRAERRTGTDRLVRILLRVVDDYAAAHPEAPRVLIGDLSRPRGGVFDGRFGAIGEFNRPDTTPGHVSHQNGLDADVYYPRRDSRERAPSSLRQVDRALAQDLVDRFVAAGAQFVFVGPRGGLRGPAGVVAVEPHHDDHLHVRLRPNGQ